MNAQFQTSLSNLETKVNALITNLTTSPAATGAPGAAANLLEADDAVTSAVETLRTHQENYSKILRLRNEAEQLEERVKGIVREVEGFDKEVRDVCGDAESESDSEDEDSDENGVKETGVRRTKKVDYKLLLDFARRISKYNRQAAADAAAGNLAAKQLQEKRQQVRDQDVQMTAVNGEPGTEEGAEPVSTVTKDATSWLDESANMTREVYMLPYPMEDRIRMGMMGQIQLAAAEGQPGYDPDHEVDRLIREAEGLGEAKPAFPPPGEEARQADEAARASAQAGATASSTQPKEAAPAPKPKATLDLDLYDPDDDDV